MENGRSFARVIYNDVVDVVIVYDVCDIWTICAFGLNSLMLARWWTSTAHSESLTIRVSSSFQSTFFLALLRHRVFCELLASEWPLMCIVAVTVDEIIAFFGVL